MSTPPMATMPAKAGPKRSAVAKMTVSDSDTDSSKRTATSQRSPMAAAATNRARSDQ